MKKVRLSALRTGRLYLQQISLVLICIGAWVDLRAVVQPEWLRQWKTWVTTLRIEPATFRPVAHCLNHLHLHVTPSFTIEILVDYVLIFNKIVAPPSIYFLHVSIIYPFYAICYVYASEYWQSSFWIITLCSFMGMLACRHFLGTYGIHLQTYFAPEEFRQ